MQEEQQYNSNFTASKSLSECNADPAFSWKLN